VFAKLAISFSKRGGCCEGVDGPAGAMKLANP